MNDQLTPDFFPEFENFFETQQQQQQPLQPQPQQQNIVPNESLYSLVNLISCLTNNHAVSVSQFQEISKDLKSEITELKEKLKTVYDKLTQISEISSEVLGAKRRRLSNERERRKIKKNFENTSMLTFINKKKL